MENKRQTGFSKEETAAEYLTQQGLVLLERNYYFPGGELDIIAKDGEYLCFIEVKYRKTASCGCSEEAVTPAKQKKMQQGAKHYLYAKRLSYETPCRFDVVAINGEELIWYQNAFF